MNTTTKRRSSKQSVFDSLKSRIQGRGLRSVPLTERVEYSYYDDHESNNGDIGWIVIDNAGELSGLDEDMQISLHRFSKAALLEIESRIDWTRGITTERAQE